VHRRWQHRRHSCATGARVRAAQAPPLSTMRHQRPVAVVVAAQRLKPNTGAPTEWASKHKTE